MEATITIVVIAIVVIIFLGVRSEKRKEEKKWELPGDWGAKTLTQVNCFKEAVLMIGELRDLIVEGRNGLLSENSIRTLDYLKDEVGKHNLNPDLIKVAAELVVKKLQGNQHFEEAKEVAAHFNL